MYHEPCGLVHDQDVLVLEDYGDGDLLRRESLLGNPRLDVLSPAHLEGRRSSLAVDEQEVLRDQALDGAPTDAETPGGEPVETLSGLGRVYPEASVRCSFSRRYDEALLPPAQKAARPEDTAVRGLIAFLIEELLRAALLGQRWLLPLYLASRLRLRLGRLLNRLVLGRRWLDLGVFGRRDFSLRFCGEGAGRFSPNHLRRLLVRRREFLLDLGLHFPRLDGLEPRERVFRILRPRPLITLRHHARLFGGQHLFGGHRFFGSHRLFRSYRFFRGPRLFLGGFVDDGDRFGIEALAQGGFDLPGGGYLHVVHHIRVGLQEVAEVVGEAFLRLLQRIVGLLDAFDSGRRVGEHLMRAALRLPDGEVRLPLGGLLYALGLLGRRPAEIVRRLFGVDQGGPDRTLQVLELLKPVAKARHLLAHPLVLGIVALELVGHGVEEIVDLVRLVAAEAALELFAPYVYWSYRHIGSPRYRSDEVGNKDQQQGPGDREPEDRDDRREVYTEPAELQHRHAAPYGPENRIGHGLDRIVDSLHDAAGRIAGEPGEEDRGDDESEEYVVGVGHRPREQLRHGESELLQEGRCHPPSLLALSVAASTPS